MDKTYDHKTKEGEIYKLWEFVNAFSPEGANELRKKANIKGNKKPFTVLMPPPNANAPLHCGHATYSIQDLMIRFKRMQGYDALYLPGTDHAGFETQYVYENKLKKEGKSRFDFDRETFYNDVFEFVKKNSMIAIGQLKRIGMSANWSRSTFMLDQKVIDTVYDTFIKMHNDGLVYRDGYMVNYSTFHGTSFSDLETEYKDAISPLYYVKYRMGGQPFKKGLPSHITIATVRPETIYADVAVAVNPSDNRYKNIVGKTVINPLTLKEIPVIEDDFVDKEFGTGAVKITPGHDFNDYIVGKKHGLEIITVINLDGTMNDLTSEVVGMHPKQARLKVGEILKNKGLLEKVDEKYQNRILVDYKNQLSIEPMILPNWFINMDKLMGGVIVAIEKNKVKFNLSVWKRDMLRWVKEKKPWPISRQTVFGIRIPAWYKVSENPDLQVTFIAEARKGSRAARGVTFIAEARKGSRAARGVTFIGIDKDKGYISGNIHEILSLGISLGEIKSGLQKVIAPADASYKISKDCPGEDFIQETDTFDTWFSSGQWPLTTTGYPGGKDFKKIFPTDFLDSMWDIMFFWIARMIMFSLYLTNEVPFRFVYFHGAVVDKFGKRMSKSKGNVIDPLAFADKYGADALRMGILAGGNTEAKFSPLDEDKVRGYRNFANKIWNIARFIKQKIENGGSPLPDAIDIETLSVEDRLLIDKLNAFISSVTKYLDKCKFKLAGDSIYHFIWDDLANDYLESMKNRKDAESIAVLRYAFLTSLKLLHPFMPFITEAVWQELKSDVESPYLIVSKWPEI